jgi:hypothetical protein
MVRKKMRPPIPLATSLRSREADFVADPMTEERECVYSLNYFEGFLHDL